MPQAITDAMHHAVTGAATGATGAPISAMRIGEIYLETLSSGIITQGEIDWLTTHQGSFSRDEEARALQIGRLLDGGSIQIGCRLLGRSGGQRPLAA